MQTPSVVTDTSDNITNIDISIGDRLAVGVRRGHESRYHESAVVTILRILTFQLEIGLL
jgi:hypothetical protein